MSGGLLVAIWQISLGLAGLSVAVLAGLVLKRAWLAPRDRRRAARKEALASQVVRAIDDPGAALDLRKTLRPGDHEIIDEIVRDLLNVLRGDDRDNLIVLLHAIDAAENYLERLESGAEIPRAQAAAALAWFPTTEVRSALRRALEDDSVVVRLAAAQALVEMGDEVSVDELATKLGIGSLLHSRDLRTLFRKLARTKGRPLVELLERDLAEDVRLLVLDGLGHTQDFSVIGDVGAQVDAPSIEIKTAALRALATLGHPAALGPVRRALSDPSWEVRTQAAVCARRIGLVETVSDLASLVEDDVWWVAFRASEALKHLGEPGIEMLREAAGRGTRGGALAQTVLAEGEAE